MSGKNDLQLMGRPDVRNAVLLNEIGVLLHDLGKLSGEFIAGSGSFPHHLILRRLSRGKDPFLGADASLLAATCCCLTKLDLGAEEKAIGQMLCKEMAGRGSAISVGEHAENWLEEAVCSNRKTLAGNHKTALDQVARLMRQLSAELRWQREAEEAITRIKPPLIPIQGFFEALDQLPFVADLVEMHGRTWHPEALMRPEVKLLRALHRGEGLVGLPESALDEEQLTQVRQLCCEALANQFLEIHNIRKDGPGDLGSWFWKGRLYAQNEGIKALLHAFDQGARLEPEEREAVHWLGVRPITQWAYSKVVVGGREDGRQKTLWEHAYELATLHKSAVAQALIEGCWPEPGRLSWRVLGVTAERPAPEVLTEIKELLEVEYPLGNELHRDGRSIHFSFPALEDEQATRLVGALAEEMVPIVNEGLRTEVSVSPIASQRQIVQHLCRGSTVSCRRD